MIGLEQQDTTSKNTSTSKKESREATDEEGQQSSSGETRLTTATRTPWILDEPGHEPHLWMKKNDKGSKVDSASVAIKRDILPDTVQTKEQELQRHPQPTHQS